MNNDNSYITVDRSNVIRRLNQKATGVYFHVTECPNEAPDDPAGAPVDPNK